MNVDFELELLQINRKRLVSIIEGTAEHLLYEIPIGFTNNVIWHIGHCVVSQQRLIYLRSGLPMQISNSMHDNFKIGSSPTSWTGIPKLDEVKEALLSTVIKLKEDMENGIFKTYEASMSSMGFMINNHLEALKYTNFHEAEHTGSARSLLKIINSEIGKLSVDAKRLRQLL